MAAIITVPGSWLLSETLCPLLQSLGSRHGGRGVSSISSITRPDERGLCCTVTSLYLAAWQKVTSSSCGSLALVLVVLWVLPQTGVASSPASWEGGHL